MSAILPLRPGRQVTPFSASTAVEPPQGAPHVAGVGAHRGGATAAGAGPGTLAA